MSSDPARRRAAWDDLLDVPEGYIGEIVAGELQVHPRPGALHAENASDLGMLLGPPFRFGTGGPGGWIILHEPRVALAEDIRVPDLAAWRVERYARPEKGPYTVVPDWICEVLSPGTATLDRTEKLPLYARSGVAFLWLIDPIGCSLEAFRLEGESYVLFLTARGKRSLRVAPFDAVELDLGLLWGDRAEQAGDRSE